jgi:hypothetical protein
LFGEIVGDPVIHRADCGKPEAGGAIKLNLNSAVDFATKRHKQHNRGALAVRLLLLIVHLTGEAKGHGEPTLQSGSRGPVREPCGVRRQSAAATALSHAPARYLN